MNDHFQRRCLCALAPLVIPACGGKRPGPTVGTAQGDPCAGAWARLFDDARFSDRRLTIAYPTERPSLAAAGTDVEGGHLNDRVSSARWSIPAGCQLVLYEDENFRGARFPLVGSGRVEENGDLRAFSDRASSARWERG